MDKTSFLAEKFFDFSEELSEELEKISRLPQKLAGEVREGVEDVIEMFRE